jgi:hypothetical protein
MPTKNRPPASQSASSHASLSAIFAPPVLTPIPPKPLAQGKALEIYQSGIYESQRFGLRLPTPITEVTLSGSSMAVDGAWLEVGGDGVRVYGDTGEIHWFKDPVPSVGAWMIVWLPGIEAGATYVGQIRCFTSPIPNHEYHIALKLVYTDKFEVSYIPVIKSSFIVPFAFISVSAQKGITPNVQFFPEYLSHCVVYDVHIKKV